VGLAPENVVTRHARVWLTALRRLTLVAVLVAVLVGVGDHDAPRATRLPELDVLVVVDLTTSMSALDDPTGSRITAARRDLVALGEQLESARFTVVTVGGDAKVVLPATSDRVAYEDIVQNLQVQPADAGIGSSADRFVALVDHLLARHPKGRRPVLVYAGDGESTDRWDASLVGVLHGRLRAAAVLGYGTQQGGVMPLVRVAPDETPPAPAAAGALVPDPATGQAAVSRSSPATLATIADEVGGSYVVCDGSQDMTSVASAIQVTAYADLAPVRAARQLGWAWGLLLLLLVLPELRRGWRQWLEARRAGKP
jgi:Ca-activated chloride channel family protein